MNPKIKKGTTTSETLTEIFMPPKNRKARVSPLSHPKIKQQDNYITNELLSQALPTPNTKLVGNSNGLNKYEKLVNIFRFSGGSDEVKTYLLNWGVSSLLHDFILVSIKHDVLTTGGVR